ncbi:MAG: hypothetical protein QNK03_15495, partial [Myxococcota bacterium]|nr:hypothetical protein [Myxococcota bacterium]
IAALLALLLRAPEPVGALRAAACGVAIGVAALFKPVALAYGLLPLLAVWRGGGGRLPARAALAGGLGGVALLAVAPFALAGTLDALVDVVWTYNRHYAENPLVNVVRGLEPMRLFHPSLRDVVPLLTVALLAPLAALPAAPSRGALVLAAWALATAVAVAAPGRSFPHYYQLWLPGLCVAAAWGLDALDRGRGGAAPWVRVLALLGVLVYLQAPAYTWPAERWSRVKYGDVFVDAQRLGRWADSVLAPDARLYNWGKESGLYWSSGRRPPSGVLLPSYHTVNWPGADALAARVVRELERAPPELVVLSDALPPDHAVARWLRAHYALSPDAPDVPGFRVLRRAPP